MRQYEQEIVIIDEHFPHQSSWPREWEVTSILLSDEYATDIVPPLGGAPVCSHRAQSALELLELLNSCQTL